MDTFQYLYNQLKERPGYLSIQLSMQEPKVILITPPFTQLNTPYPATAYLKGFLNTKGISSLQWDLSIELALKIFCKDGLTRVFELIQNIGEPGFEKEDIYQNRYHFIDQIDAVISFLQSKNPSFAYRIVRGDYFELADLNLDENDLNVSFGYMGLQDKAKYISSALIAKLSRFITDNLDPHFGLSRYAESLSSCVHSMDDLYSALLDESGLIDTLIEELLDQKTEVLKTSNLVAITVPFPGNLYSALRCAQYIKLRFPSIKLALGGGYVNTELRSLSDKRIFEFVDFISFDAGETALLQIINYIDGSIPVELLKRTMICDSQGMRWVDGSLFRDVNAEESGTPDYSDLRIHDYISVLEVVNPMHSLWSDGYWNKLTMANGCYWKKCTFCDVSLPYISDYIPHDAALLCDRVEKLIQDNSCSGFHFVDEAAPPALMKRFSEEILRRNIQISWWTNIRFEKSFNYELCELLRESGCIAVTGGLEVASDRLLKLINKGVSVVQVARVMDAFAASGIMVHAYLMYGFPTQTEQETVDSLEMVRQMFELGILQSAHWHRFALTVHSPVACEPEKYKILVSTDSSSNFANNELEYKEPHGIDHSRYGEGLRKSLFNFMHGSGIDFDLQAWFDFNIPRTTISPDFIANAIETEA